MAVVERGANFTKYRKRQSNLHLNSSKFTRHCKVDEGNVITTNACTLIHLNKMESIFYY